MTTINQQLEVIMEVKKINSQNMILALPPEHQRARELERMQQDPRLVEKLGNQAILAIEKTETGYLIHTELCTLAVDVNYLPNGCCGPAQFELFFHEPNWKN